MSVKAIDSWSATIRPAKVDLDRCIREAPEGALCVVGEWTTPEGSVSIVLLTPAGEKARQELGLPNWSFASLNVTEKGEIGYGADHRIGYQIGSHKTAQEFVAEVRRRRRFTTTLKVTAY